MTVPRLSRAGGDGRAAPPVRLVHLGLGNFFRAHACWYAERAPDAAEWGFAAFTGRGTRPVVAELSQQDGLYTLVVRGGEGDRFEVLGSLSAPVDDARADEVVPLAGGALRAAVPRVLGRLDPTLADDGHVVAAVADQAEQLALAAAR